MQINSDLLQGEAERASAHEAGHIVVGMSLGGTIDRISRIEGIDVPGVLQAGGFDSAAAVDFTPGTRSKLEPRKQFLVALGGIAAETIVFGFYRNESAAQDFDSLKPNVLTHTQVKDLVEVAQLTLRQNLSVFNYVREQLREWLNNANAGPIPGEKLNQRFLQKGVIVDVKEHLDRVLPE